MDAENWFWIIPLAGICIGVLGKLYTHYYLRPRPAASDKAITGKS